MGVRVETETELVLVEGAAYRRVHREQLYEDRVQELYGLIGFRYTSLDAEIDFVGVGDVEEKEAWIDLGADRLRGPHSRPDKAHERRQPDPTDKWISVPSAESRKRSLEAR